MTGVQTCALPISLILGNCGSSKLNLGDFYKQIEEKGFSPNIASLIGHGTVRKQVMGGSFRRPPDAGELAQMQKYIESGMVDGRIVGLSAIYTSVSLKKPSVFFKRSISQLKSKSLNFTKDLDVLSLHLCKQPYSELGTLFLKPAFRGKGRGSLLSFSRFIFMSAHQQRFDPKLFVEIRGFKNAKNESYFWNSFSKTFFNLDFFKADEISYIDNHFIMESIPKHPFIIEHMPKKVQRVIGKPHPNAMPAFSLLRKQNFRPNGLIDVLDGGPCLEAKIKDIPLVKSAKLLPIVIKKNINFDRFGFIALDKIGRAHV